MLDLNGLKKAVANCKKCQLCEKRTNTVFGDGNINSKIMVIGEAPGEQEDLQGLPFVGKAGQLLDKMLASIGLNRANVYICNVVKCRPPMNRNPNEDEIAQCINYLRNQYVIMKPALIIVLGSVAGKALLGDDFRITRQHGELIEKGKTKFISTFHPSALLRDENKKKIAWQDLLKTKELITSMSLI